MTHSSREKSPQVGVGVIVMREVSVLLGLRRGSHGAGSWAFPGGKMVFGESIEECAARELMEETGLVAGKPSIAGVTNDLFPGSSLHFVTVYVAMADVAGEPSNREADKCERWEWFSHDRLPSPLFGPTRQLVSSGVLIEIAGRASEVSGTRPHLLSGKAKSDALQLLGNGGDGSELAVTNDAQDHESIDGAGNHEALQ